MKVKLLVAGVTLALCSTGAFAQAPAKSAAPAKADPALAECRAKNKALDNEVDSMFNKAKAAGQIDAKEQAEFNRMEANIKKHRAALAKDGFTLADCKEMTKDYEKEKAAVVAMSSTIEKRRANLNAKVDTGAPLKACREKNMALDKEVDEMFNKAKAAGKINAQEEAEFKRMESNIKKHRAALARDGFTLADCNEMTKDYEKEKAAVARMAGEIGKRPKDPPKK